LSGDQLERAKKVSYSRKRSLPRAGTILLSGCADHEFSYDTTFDGRPNGAFTRAAIDTLAPVGTRQSYAAWHKAIRAAIDFDSYPQTPQLSASLWQRRLPALL
jgi:hypothetical protein